MQRIPPNSRAAAVPSTPSTSRACLPPLPKCLAPSERAQGDTLALIRCSSPAPAFERLSLAAAAAAHHPEEVALPTSGLLPRNWQQRRGVPQQPQSEAGHRRGMPSCPPSSCLMPGWRLQCPPLPPHACSRTSAGLEVGAAGPTASPTCSSSQLAPEAARPRSQLVHAVSVACATSAGATMVNRMAGHQCCCWLHFQGSLAAAPARHPLQPATPQPRQPASQPPL